MVAPNLAARVYNGNGEISPRLPKEPGQVRIVFLSRIARKKNLDGALKMLGNVSGHVQFDIYGPIEDATYWQECRKLIDQLPARVQVTYRGAITPEVVPSTLAQYHALLFPTHGENFGHVVLEAWRSGCVVVMSDQTPWRGLRERQIGWDISLKSPAKFQAAISELLAMDDGKFKIWSHAAQVYGGHVALDANALAANRQAVQRKRQAARESFVAAAANFKRGLSMKTLVTGGAGFIGSNIVKRLLDEGHVVCVLDDLSSGYRVNLEPFPPVNFVEGDVRDAAVVDRVMQDVEVVFHLAASVGNKRSIDHPLDDAAINVLGTLNVLEAARQAGTRKIVFSSSAGIFGELKTLPIREDHPVEPDSPYGASKLGAEKACLAYSKLYALEAVCLRYFNVYGVNQRYDAYGNVIPIFAQRLLHGAAITIFGDGEQTRDFVNVTDVVQANYRAAMARGVSGAFNIASATRVTINELARLMMATSGLAAPIEYAPPRSGDVRHSLADIGAAQTAFGYQPTVGLKEGLREYMEWAAADIGRGWDD